MVDIQVDRRGARYKNLVGSIFGRLIVQRDIGRRNGTVLWQCKCICGNIINVRSSELSRSDGTRSCGCLQKEMIRNYKRIDLIGQRFGRLSVIKESERRSGGKIVWICKCDCGKEAYVASGDLKNGHTKSCGCLQKEKAIYNARILGFAMRGYNHPNWRGGVAKYKRIMWNEDFLKSIRKRDFCKCQICGTNKSILDIHHIDCDKSNCVSGNLITLCRSCHKKVHYGFPIYQPVNFRKNYQLKLKNLNV